MNIYIDESGSINNHTAYNKYFVICLVHVMQNESLRKSYKRFVASNFDRLRQLDIEKTPPPPVSMGKKAKFEGKMFKGNSFKELKGSQFDHDMKIRFVEFFAQKPSFEINYIVLDNHRLSDRFCENCSRAFNYALKEALVFFIHGDALPDEDCYLQLDDRNEKTETKFFLENYLNTELHTGGAVECGFDVQYFDSRNNALVQIADVFSNLFYSYLHTGQYEEQFALLKERGILREVFHYPPVSMPASPSVSE